MIWAKRFAFHFLWITEHLFGLPGLSWSGFREEFFEKHIKPTLGPNRFDPIEVRELRFIDKEALKSLPLDRPVILKGLIDHKKCLERWSWDYLKREMGEVPQPYTDTTRDNFHTGIKKASELLEDILSTSPKFSIMFSDMLTRNPALFADLETERWIDLKPFSSKLNKSWQFFAAGQGRNTNLHSELGSTFVVQVVGKKRWVLFAPKYSMNLCPKVNWKMYLESTEHSNFAKAKSGSLGINGYEAVLEPGDVLFFPTFYWHFITNETAAVSVSFKWTEPLAFLRHPFLSTILVTCRNPSAIFRLPVLKKLSRNHPPVG